MPNITGCNGQLCSSSEADAKLKQSGVSEPTVPSRKSESKKTLEFDSNKFVPSAALFGFGKRPDPQQVSAPRIQLPSTPAVLPSVVVPMTLPKFLLDVIFGIPSDWSEWCGQLPVSVEESFSADRVKMSYLKTLFAGKSEAATEGMGHCGQMSNSFRQTLEHDAGRPALVEKSQRKKIQAYPFIEPHDSIENMKYSLVLYGYVKVLTKFATKCTLVESQC